MRHPTILSLVLVLLLCACSKKDEPASGPVANPSVTAADSSKAVTAPTDNGKASSPPSETANSATDEPASSKATDKHRKDAAKPASDEAKQARADAKHRWDQFQATVNRCATAAPDTRDQCMSEARQAYRSAHFECDSLPSPERKDCMEFEQRWKNVAEAAPATAPAAAVKHATDPTTTSASPGDPRPAERNRDSTKQQQDAAGTLRDPSKPN